MVKEISRWNLHVEEGLQPSGNFRSSQQVLGPLEGLSSELSPYSRRWPQLIMLRLPRFYSASGMFAIPPIHPSIRMDAFNATIRKKSASLIVRRRRGSINGTLCMIAGIMVSSSFADLPRYALSVINVHTMQFIIISIYYFSHLYF